MCSQFGEHKGHEAIPLEEYAEEARTRLVNGIEAIRNKSTIFKDARASVVASLEAVPKVIVVITTLLSATALFVAVVGSR
jgi:hypothetical protein